MRAREILALAVDYDRTLTDQQLRPVPRALDALRAARAAGLRVLVVSGRDLPFLETHLLDVADVLVAENGCLVRRETGVQPTGGRTIDLRATLGRLGIPIEYGSVIASADVAYEPLLREALLRAGVEVDLVRNRDRVMLLPPGIDKAAGLLAGLRAVGVPPERCAAAGDGENDIPMLQAAGYGIAVENAVEELKAIADHVTSGYGGHGVAEWVLGTWLPAKGVEAR